MKNANLVHWIVSVAALGVAAASLIVPTITPRRDLHELVLRDEEGRARIRMSARKAGARIELLDENQRVLAALSQDASATNFVLSRANKDGLGIELIVPSVIDSESSRARVTVHSYDAQEAATLAAGVEATVELVSGQGGNLEMSQGRTRSRINAVSAHNWATFDVDKGTSKFSSKLPLAIELPGDATTKPN
jgi:hypothetical protein